MKRNITMAILGSIALLLFAIYGKPYTLAHRCLVRAVLLEPLSGEFCVGVIYQDVTASADASKAGEQLKLAQGKGRALRPHLPMRKQNCRSRQTTNYAIMFFCAAPPARVRWMLILRCCLKTRKTAALPHIFTRWSTPYKRSAGKAKQTIPHFWIGWTHCTPGAPTARGSIRQVHLHC